MTIPENQQRRNHVATKLQEDPYYEAKISARLKEAIQFARVFREERKCHLCTQEDVAALSGISLDNVRDFELMEMNEGRFLSYHQKFFQLSRFSICGLKPPGRPPGLLFFFFLSKLFSDT